MTVMKMNDDASSTATGTSNGIDLSLTRPKEGTSHLPLPISLQPSPDWTIDPIGITSECPPGLLELTFWFSLPLVKIIELCQTPSLVCRFNTIVLKIPSPPSALTFEKLGRIGEVFTINIRQS
jgi:hypothetical protein